MLVKLTTVGIQMLQNFFNWFSTSVFWLTFLSFHKRLDPIFAPSHFQREDSRIFGDIPSFNATEIWCQFHQLFTYSFYARRSWKHKKILKTKLYFFALSGSTSVKAVRGTLMKSTQATNFLPWKCGNSNDSELFQLFQQYYVLASLDSVLWAFISNFCQQ